MKVDMHSCRHCSCYNDKYSMNSRKQWHCLVCIYFPKINIEIGSTKAIKNTRSSFREVV
jgi:hypothetical protein